MITILDKQLNPRSIMKNKKVKQLKDFKKFEIKESKKLKVKGGGITEELVVI